MERCIVSKHYFFVLWQSVLPRKREKKCILWFESNFNLKLKEKEDIPQEQGLPRFTEMLIFGATWAKVLSEIKMLDDQLNFSL